MKGSIGFIQGAVLYIIIMLVVVFVGIAIVTKGQFLMLFQMEKFSQLFEPGAITIGPASMENGQPLGHLLPERNMDVVCGPGNVYDVTLKGVSFDYKGGGGKNLGFYVVLDVGNKLVQGMDENGNSVFICASDNREDSIVFNCPSSVNINFRVQTDAPAHKEFFHFTIWRVEPGVTNILELSDGSEGKSLSNLLDSQFQNYVGSFDAGGVTIGDACSDFLCRKYSNERSCSGDYTCWFEPGLLGFGGTCHGCKTAISCAEYDNRNECLCGSLYADLGCYWNSMNNKCEAG